MTTIGTPPPETPAEIRLAQYGERTSTWSTATYDSGTEKALHQIAVELKGELDRVRAELAKYVGNEPTISEEIAFLSRCVEAVHEVCDAAEEQSLRWENPLSVPDWVTVVREAADGVRRESKEDSLPAWLSQRFDPHGASWDSLDADDRAYWEHQARAVRRAVARGGFKAEAGDRS